MTLEGKVAVVTGGLSGLGYAIADRLAREGADVVTLTLPRPALPEEVKHFEPTTSSEEFVRAVEGHGRRATVVEGDAASAADIERAITHAEAIGGIDLLVNNAATNCIQGVVGHDEELFRRVLDVNLVGPFLAIRACLPRMLERGFGRIVSIGSIAGTIGIASHGAYCASKHALLGLHRSVVKEVEGHDITLNVVSPSLVDTPSAHLHLRKEAEAEGVLYEAWLARYVEQLPQRRLVGPDEVAAVVAFLCGPEGRLVHGADVLVTAGSTS